MVKRTTNYYAIGGVVFMPHPVHHGAWIKTDSSVVLADCLYCHAKKGQLCSGAGGGPRRGGTHSARRQTANMVRRRLQREAKSKPKTIVHVVLE